MAAAHNGRTIEFNLLNLLVVPDIAHLACKDHRTLNNIVHMGLRDDPQYAVQTITCIEGCQRSTTRLTAEARAELEATLQAAAKLVRKAQEIVGGTTRKPELKKGSENSTARAQAQGSSKRHLPAVGVEMRRAKKVKSNIFVPRSEDLEYTAARDANGRRVMAIDLTRQ
ncbi:hypothetical protein NMY22_g9877 [Coprinellus aureogranulatus]|nr:hypothetical protein NMY22_g9877 [Coprinellus aureogranulatus]